uniref:HDC01124 n=1 Tax=Drosophila melanogaster TaxID=7227 RepID=Q6IHT3_DROME|nr:TPA_inf: HDC01124 [Drosophila melanogaster]
MTHSSTTFEPENLSCVAKGVEGQATLGIQPNDNGQAIQCPNAGVAKSKSLSRCPANSRPDQVFYPAPVRFSDSPIHRLPDSPLCSRLLQSHDQHVQFRGDLLLQGGNWDAGWWMVDGRRSATGPRQMCQSQQQARPQKYLQMQRIVRRFVYRRLSEWQTEGRRIIVEGGAP